MHFVHDYYRYATVEHPTLVIFVVVFGVYAFWRLWPRRSYRAVLCHACGDVVLGKRGGLFRRRYRCTACGSSKVRALPPREV